MKRATVLDELADLVGISATVALVKAFGGRELDIPKCPQGRGRKRYGELAAVVGDDIAKRLCEYYSGERVNIGLDSVVKYQRRNRMILQAYQGGESVASLVARFGMVESNIRRILRKARDAAARGESVDAHVFGEADDGTHQLPLF